MKINRGWSGTAVALALFAAGVVAAPLGAQQVRTVEGVVREEGTSTGLAGVQVITGSRSVLTDATGAFRIEVPSDTTTLSFRRVGYGTAQVRAAEFDGAVDLAVMPVTLDAITAATHRGHDIAVGTALAVQRTTSDEIMERAPASLAESMMGMEGMTVARTGAWGARPVLRGLGGERLAILVDGSRLNRACTFGMDQGLATIDASTVERVEVLTGPGSTLYGSGNIGGVINVVTRRGTSSEPFSGEIRTGASSALPGGTVGSSLWFRGDQWDLSVGADAARYGDYYVPGGRVEGSGFEQLSGDAKLSFAPTAAHRIQVQTQIYEGRDIGWPGMPAGSASIPEESRNAVSADYAWQRGGDFLDAVSARAYRQRLDHHMQVTMQMNNGGMAMTSETDARSFSTTSGGRVQLRLLPFDAAQLDIGTEATRWAAEGTRWLETTRMGSTQSSEFHTWPAVSVLDVGTFVQGEAALAEAVSLSAGLRLDHVGRSADGWPSTSEWVRTGNLGLRTDLGAGFAARGTFGFGYRIADPTELFGIAVRPDGYLYRGNPDLRTEIGRNVEAAIDYASDEATFSMTLFRNDLRNLIAPRAVADETIDGRAVREYQNIDRARLTGVSGSVGLPLLYPLELSSTVTYTHGRDDRTGLPLPQVPPLEATTGLTWRTDRVLDYVALESRMAARQTRNAADAGEIETPGFAVFHLRTGFNVAGMDVNAGVENLLDHAYRGHLDLPVTQPGRNLYIRIVRGF